MKYIVILGDGMADYPVAELGSKTPLQYANTPNMDKLVRHGKAGMVKTVPDGFSPASDVANLSVMGYNPAVYYTGRSPLEAVSMGIDLDVNDTTLRCNLVTLSEEIEYKNRLMIDYSSDEISSREAAILIKDISEALGTETLRFFSGISYRHLMVWKNGPVEFEPSPLTPPHNIIEKNIRQYLPRGKYGSVLLDMMQKSISILKNHPVNMARLKKGLRPANSIWLWGEGRKPSLPSFFEKYSINGSVISAVDLIKGIGICAGLDSINVEGATGNINTNFEGKAVAALKELESGKDFVYVHIEAPDECGHRYEIQNKVKAIELIDEKIAGTIINGLKYLDNYRILILPDHPTPLSIRTHTSEPVPFILYDNTEKNNQDIHGYDELQPAKTGLYIDKGYMLMDYFIGTRKL